MQKLNISTLKHLLIQRLVSEGYVDNHREADELGQGYWSSLSNIQLMLQVQFGLNVYAAWEFIARASVLETDE